MFAISFDMVLKDLVQHYPGFPSAAYKDIARTLAASGFRPIQGSVYVNEAESLVDVTNAMNALRGLPWFRDSVRDIRVFRIEQWSDFTAFHKAP
jgi:virulence-associated protein VapD